MSRKKNIAKYQKEQAAKRKKQEKEKIMKKVYLVLIVLLSIALAATIGYLIYREVNKPVDPSTIPPDLSDPITVALEIKDYGKITLELYPKVAPVSVENFLNYVKDGFYDGLKFHRVIEDFMIQGGDPTGTGYGDPSLKQITGEFTNNGFINNLKFERGVIGMARGDGKNSASSQFFICHKDSPHLNKSYASFGKVIDGLDVVDAIATCPKTDERDASGTKYVPVTDIIIEKAYIVE